MITLVILSSLIVPSLNVNGGATTTERDYSDLADNDFRMGNEYVNITAINSLVEMYSVNVSVDPGTVNRYKIHDGAINYQPYGRWLRVNETFYKYPIDNANQLIMQSSVDLKYFNERDLYLNGSLLDISGSECFGTSAFYFNSTFYLFYSNFTSGYTEVVWGDSPHNFTDKAVAIIPYTGREIIPMSIYFINDTFYMIVQNYSGVSDDYIELFKSDALLSNWSVCPGFKNLFPGSASDWHTSGQFYLYNGSYWFVNQFYDNSASHMALYHYEVNGSLENFSTYDIHHHYNDTRFWFIEYMPIGETIIQWAYDYLSLDYYIIRYMPNHINIYHNPDIVHKIYPGGIVEYSTISFNDSVKWSDYFSLNPFGVYIDYIVQTGRGNRTFFSYQSSVNDLVYLQTRELQYDEPSYGPVLTNIRVFYPYNGVDIQQTFLLYINVMVYGFYNVHEVEVASTNYDFATMTETLIITLNGTASFKRAALTLRHSGSGSTYRDSSINLTVYHNPTDVAPWWLIPGTDWRETLGIVVLIVGLIVIVLGAIAKTKTVVTWGLLLVMSGLGLIGGSGLFSVLF